MEKIENFSKIITNQQMLVHFKFDRSMFSFDHEVHCLYIYHAGVIVEVVFVYKNWPFLTSQIQMGVSQRVFIPLQASKYMLESKRKSLRK